AAGGRGGGGPASQRKGERTAWFTAAPACFRRFTKKRGSCSSAQIAGEKSRSKAHRTPSRPVFTPSAGHTADVPLHASARSQGSVVASRHVVPALTRTSAGQVLLVPVQFSAMSQTPALARQSVVASAKPSVGQVALVPVQRSATSQMPTLGRQTVVAGANASAGHAADEPVQLSATSQAVAAARHTLGARKEPAPGP